MVVSNAVYNKLLVGDENPATKINTLRTEVVGNLGRRTTEWCLVKQAACTPTTWSTMIHVREHIRNYARERTREPAAQVENILCQYSSNTSVHRAHENECLAKGSSWKTWRCTSEWCLGHIHRQRAHPQHGALGNTFALENKSIFETTHEREHVRPLDK